MLSITEKNIEYILDAYQREPQPCSVVVPYDAEGHEVVLPAPSRFVIQAKLNFYDICQVLGNKALQIRFIPASPYAPRVLIYDLAHPQHTPQSTVVPGETIYYRGIPHVYNICKEEHGLERITEVLPEFSNFEGSLGGKKVYYTSHTLCPGLTTVSWTGKPPRPFSKWDSPW